MFRARSASLRLALGLASVLCPLMAAGAAPRPERQQETPVPWPEETVATLRSFFERVDVETVLDGVRAPDGTGGQEDPSRILGRLPEGVEAPFRFVRGAVQHASYAGSRLGARGVAAARIGNALDQTLLLRELYAARGHRTRLVRGRLGWSDAVALVGDQPSALASGDPWLRRVELASDHWWLELRHGSDWIAVDPAFGDARWGEARARVRSHHDEVPEPLQASLVLEVEGERGPLGRLALPLADLVGLPFELAAIRRPGVEDRAPGPDGPPAAEAEPRPAESELDPLQTLLRQHTLPHHALRVLLGGRTVDLPLTGAAESVILRVEIRRPLGSPETLVVPLRLERDPHVSILLHAGPAEPALAEAALPLFGAFRDLARIERETLDAWVERPRPEDETDRDALLRGGEPRVGAAEAPEVDSEEAGELHPGERLHLAALQSWGEFASHGPRALGLAALASADRLRAGVDAPTRPVRLAVVRWTAPGAGEPGRFGIWTHDAPELSMAEGEAARGIRSAAGFLHSALLGQLLHGVADAAPATTFDLTLRSVGTGQRLVWWGESQPFPAAWPAAARELAGLDRLAGRLLVGPPGAVGGPSGELQGWWAIDPVSGTTHGRVVQPAGVAEAAVEFGEPLEAADLGSSLASLPALHHGLRWLISAAEAGGGALVDLLPRACAATSLVGDLLVAGAPDRFPAPHFAVFCARPPGTAGGRPNGVQPSPPTSATAR